MSLEFFYGDITELQGGSMALKFYGAADGERLVPPPIVFQGSVVYN